MNKNLNKIKFITATIVLAAILLTIFLFFFIFKQTPSPALPTDETRNTPNQNQTSGLNKTAGSDKTNNWEKQLEQNDSGKWNNGAITKSDKNPNPSVSNQNQNSALPTLQTTNSANQIYGVPTNQTNLAAENPTTTNPQKDFGNKTGGIIIKLSPKAEIQQQIFSVAATTTKNVDAQTVLGLKNVAQNYKDLSDALLEAAAPSDMKNLKQALISGYSEISSALFDIANNTNSNSKISINKWTNYGQKAAAANSAFIAIMDYYKNNKISFSPIENGYIFMYSL